ncbi:uncharacterized protein F4812DRAFT_421647 [Daldinia caldariorum]|uniref:uncharacterized protein n=1 Tax=Daldinia caldariorum TaxID=326644 RepID=UPI0020088E98|nr:uncharacterized protein F4812DRAFT_421647 [Daldinia caldariorum]KAI1470148.1 hypothetical protein F4812DRAFT_421647 [Daldinia caldariorum]
MNAYPRGSKGACAGLFIYRGLQPDKSLPIPRGWTDRAESAGAIAVELECGQSPFLIDKETTTLVDIINKVSAA